jgi:Protein of unknown function (DUF1236)
MKNTMRHTLLATVAATALIAGAGLASAQGPGESREAPGAATHEPKAPAGKTDQQPNSMPPQKSPAPNAQAPMKPAPTAQAPAKETPAPTAQAPAKETPAPTAQAPMKDKPAPTAQAPMKEKPAETAQAPAAVKPQAAEPPNSRMAPSTAKDETKSGPPAALSSEQHAKIRDTLRIEKSERLATVPFSTKVGEAIPGTVHLYVLPVSIMEYAPQYRGYEYILVGNEILIVDPRTMRIVAVIDA